jgi:hypothetical protein
MHAALIGCRTGLEHCRLSSAKGRRCTSKTEASPRSGARGGVVLGDRDLTKVTVHHSFHWLTGGAPDDWPVIVMRDNE